MVIQYNGYQYISFLYIGSVYIEKTVDPVTEIIFFSAYFQVTWNKHRSSLYGFIIMVISIVFLLIRIEIEEEMLVEAFGQEYEEYRKKTRRLIPYIY